MMAASKDDMFIVDAVCDMFIVDVVYYMLIIDVVCDMFIVDAVRLYQCSFNEVDFFPAR